MICATDTDTKPIPSIGGTLKFKNRDVSLTLECLKKMELEKLSAERLKKLGRGKLVGMGGMKKKELVEYLTSIVDWDSIPHVNKRCELVRRANKLGINNPQCYNMSMLKYYIHERENDSDVKIHMGLSDLDKIYKDYGLYFVFFGREREDVKRE